MNNIQTDNFSQNYNTLQEAQQLLKTLDSQYNLLLNKSMANSGSYSADSSALKQLKSELSMLTDLLMNNQEVDSDEFTQRVDKVFVSILSTSKAYAGVIDALVEVQRRLAEEMKRYLQKQLQDKEQQMLAKNAQEMREDFDKLLETLQNLKEEGRIKSKRDFADIQNFLIHLRERYNIDVHPALNRIEFNQVV